MEDLRRVTGQTLNWIQPKLSRREYELKLDDRVFGAFNWGKFFGSVSSASTAAGDWDLVKTGFLHPIVTVRDRNTLADLAVLQQPWTGAGSVAFSSGTKYDWKGEGFIPSKWSFIDYKGQEAITFKSNNMSFKLSVEVVPKTDDKEIALLAVLGLLNVIRTRDAASSGAIAAMP